jgi:hypothetical protein
MENNKGFIYKIISPSGKAYIGQVTEYLRNGEKKGIRGRWLQHCRSAKYKKGCVYLNNAINKYKPENFKIIQLMKCDLDKIDLYEELFIKTHKTLTPNGYNLQTGGTFTKHSEETCKKRSESLKKLLKDPEKRKIWSKAKLGKVQKEKRKCKKAHNQDLPKYIYYRESHGGKYKGYVVEHPKGTKRFGRKIFSLEENLEKAKEYLHLLN